MKKLLLLLLLIPNLVMAETYLRWKHITDDWYIDTSSIERKNGNIFVWQMINSEGTYKPTMTPVLSTSVLQEYDCSSGTIKPHAIRMYEKEMGEGDMIAYAKMHGEMSEVPANPVGQLIFKEVCGFH